MLGDISIQEKNSSAKLNCTNTMVAYNKRELVQTAGNVTNPVSDQILWNVGQNEENWDFIQM